MVNKWTYAVRLHIFKKENRAQPTSLEIKARALGGDSRKPSVSNTFKIDDL